MPISIACPHCDWKGRVKDELAGKTGKCPTCGELFPIPKKGAPPAIPAGKKPVDDEPDVVDDADVVEDEPRSKKAGGRPAPGAKGRRDEDEDRPRRRRDEDDDDRPSKSRRRAADEDEDDRPSKARRRAVDDEEDDRPSKRRRDVDDDEDDDDRPRKKKRTGGKVRRREGGGSSGKKIGTIVSGVLCLLVGLGLLVLSIVLGKMNYWGIGLVVVGILSIGQGLMQSGSDD